MPKTLAPDVRSQFAKRLKDIRSLRGFGRARYFAKQLGIEENRYTRYERAEVEPSLTLIHKMCETLRVTPNELMGYLELPAKGRFETAPGLAEPSSDPASQPYGREGNALDRGGELPGPLSSLAWRVASEAVAIRHAHAASSHTGGDPFDTVRDTWALFRRLQSEPFESVHEIADDPALKSAEPSRKAALAALITAYTESVSQAGAGRRAR